MVEMWSPYPKEAYTVMFEGAPAGLGAREEFINNPGLWNLFWLNSERVDLLLDWSRPPHLAPADAPTLQLCIDSMSYDCDGVSLSYLCQNMTAEAFVSFMVKNHFAPPIVMFWSQMKRRTWEDFVRDRMAKDTVKLGLLNPCRVPDAVKEHNTLLH